MLVIYMNMVFLLVKYGRILQKYDIFENDQKMLKSLSFSYFFYHFCFYFFNNYFHFCLALKVGKNSKTIIRNR